jgi:uncharacterized membrane protein YphA (DoxX/SURF4 family)
MKESLMSATALTDSIPGSAARPRRALDQLRDDPAYQAFTLLRIAFTVAPIAFGIDKFFNVLVNWESYLAPWIHDASPLSATHTMEVVGVIEIIAGIAVAVKPRYGAYIVAAWLGGIVVNLLSYSGYYDIALRDFGLMLAALTLARLASKFDPPGLSFPTRHRRQQTAVSNNEGARNLARTWPLGR